MRVEADIEVGSLWPGSAVVPHRRAAGADGGRGVGVIEALSVRWGVDDYPGGKRVWVQLLPHP